MFSDISKQKPVMLSYGIEHIAAHANLCKCKSRLHAHAVSPAHVVKAYGGMRCTQWDAATSKQQSEGFEINCMACLLLMKAPPESGVSSRLSSIFT